MDTARTPGRWGTRPGSFRDLGAGGDCQIPRALGLRDRRGNAARLCAKYAQSFLVGMMQMGGNRRCAVAPSKRAWFTRSFLKPRASRAPTDFPAGLNVRANRVRGLFSCWTG